MAEDIFNPAYWKERIDQSLGYGKGQLHHSIFRCNVDRWKLIEDKHRVILSKHVKDKETILDAGCGYGRLLTLLPPTWNGVYLGVDISPDFISMAKKEYRFDPRLPAFLYHDLTIPTAAPDQSFDWGILISIRPMIRRNVGEKVWFRIETELKRVCKRLLFLEYDPSDEGSIE